MMRKYLSEVELDEIRSFDKNAKEITHDFTKFVSRTLFVNNKWIDSQIDKSKWRVCEIDVKEQKIHLVNKNAEGYKMRNVNLVIEACEYPKENIIRVGMHLGGHGSTPHLPSFTFKTDELTHAMHSVPSIMKQYENGYKVSQTDWQLTPGSIPGQFFDGLNAVMQQCSTLIQTHH